MNRYLPTGCGVILAAAALSNPSLGQGEPVETRAPNAADQAPQSVDQTRAPQLVTEVEIEREVVVSGLPPSMIPLRPFTRRPCGAIFPVPTPPLKWQCA